MTRTPQTFAPRLLATLTLGAAWASAWALPAFTVNPSGAAPGLIGSTVTADNLVLSNRSHVSVNADTGAFTQSGLLSVQTLQLSGLLNSESGLNNTYGLYVAYNATGTMTLGDMNSAFTSGAYTSFNYTLYGFAGPAATYSFNAANDPITSASNPFALGTGSLIQGSTSTSPASNGDVSSFVPSSNVTLSFAVAPGEAGFFGSPSPFFNTAFASFTNTVSQVQSLSATEYRIQQGGGALNFGVSAVPEPEGYAMMMAGLGIVGFLSRRRSVRDVG